MKILIIFALYILSPHTFGSILPPNDWYKYDDPSREANLSEARFNQLIDEATKTWIPLASLHGATFAPTKLWSSSTVNAFAVKEGNAWSIEIHGGIARRPELTEDGFTIVLCHELGHLFGGYHFQKYASGLYSSEGQSDYFASQVCTKVLWRSQIETNAKVAATAPDYVKDQCRLVWQSPNEQALCARNALAGSSLAHLLAALVGGLDPSFTTPDLTEVTETQGYHPEPQCRLDTYFQGGLCPLSLDLNIIPGLNHPAGHNSVKAEAVAAKYSCMSSNGYKMGIRSRCWFKPQTP